MRSSRTLGVLKAHNLRDSRIKTSQTQRLLRTVVIEARRSRRRGYHHPYSLFYSVCVARMVRDEIPFRPSSLSKGVPTGTGPDNTGLVYATGGPLYEGISRNS